MADNCNGNCDGCGAAGCSDRKGPGVQKAEQNEASNVKHVIAVISGKGGVGKSMVTGLLADSAQARGLKTAILDADITGPSIPRMFGIKDKAGYDGKNVVPVKTSNGIDTMSINLLLDNETDPVLWRGSLISGAVKQFWTDVAWGDVDCMFVDMPPGTGDVALTVMQSLPVEGIVIVTSPQELVGMIVSKAVKMAEMMNIPVLGIVENLSYFKCPDCGKIHEIFGKSSVESVAADFGIPVTVRLPIDPEMAAICDKGEAQKLRVQDIEDKFDALTEEILK
ncbi:MAG: Mrp/NBP35 family ATP-binding protein [Lachnospiraceae bacterium]|nr:Mrp/NBP35 family ATP-binding protein [Lachnospiraceae bacterium]